MNTLLKNEHQWIKECKNKLLIQEAQQCKKERRCRHLGSWKLVLWMIGCTIDILDQMHLPHAAPRHEKLKTYKYVLENTTAKTFSFLIIFKMYHQTLIAKSFDNHGTKQSKEAMARNGRQNNYISCLTILMFHMYKPTRNILER